MWKIMKTRMSWSAVAGAAMFMLLQVLSDLNLPTITSQLIDKGVARGDLAYIWQAGGKMLLFAGLSILAAIGNVYLASTQAQKLGARLREELFAKVVNFGDQEMGSFGSSSLITRTTNDVMQIQNVVIMMLRMMLMSPLMLLGAGFMAYVTERRLAMIFLISVPLLLLAVWLVMRNAVPLFKSLQKKIDSINLVFREGLTGVRVIRAFRRDSFEQERFDQVNQDYTQTGIKVFSLTSMMYPIMITVLSFTNIGIVLLGSRLIGAMEMEVGKLVSFMTYASMVLFSFMMLSMVFVFIPRAQAAASRINEVLATPDSLPTPDDVQTVAATTPASLEFEQVSFRYHGAEELALTGLNIKMDAGQTLAIIGGTGSGKTTLINLIPRLYDVEQGRVLVDGLDVRNMAKHDLHRRVAFAQQKAILFKGTIRSNLQFGKPDATDEEMWHALEVAQAKDFVAALPDGLDAVVEQNGDNFSGGQKQRLTIARAVIKPASIYVFDDSFSALDFKTDANLRAALKHDPAIQKSVVVIVAQRVATVTQADQIIVLDNGKVAGQGTHAELMANNPTYQEIVHSQIREGGQA
ncbi:ABC transporter ATP-binding protein [Ligilactobacillus saerimneri]